MGSLVGARTTMTSPQASAATQGAPPRSHTRFHKALPSGESLATKSTPLNPAASGPSPRSSDGSEVDAPRITPASRSVVIVSTLILYPRDQGATEPTAPPVMGTQPGASPEPPEPPEPPELVALSGSISPLLQPDERPRRASAPVVKAACTKARKSNGRIMKRAD